jgi:hypothetical protein
MDLRHVNVLYDEFGGRARAVHNGDRCRRSRARSGLELLNGLEAEHHRETVQRAENVLAELAMGTGSTYFHNNKDLQRGLQQLMARPEHLYVLESSLDGVKRDESRRATLYFFSGLSAGRSDLSYNEP